MASPPKESSVEMALALVRQHPKEAVSILIIDWLGRILQCERGHWRSICVDELHRCGHRPSTDLHRSGNLARLGVSRPPQVLDHQSQPQRNAALLAEPLTPHAV